MPAWILSSIARSSRQATRAFTLSSRTMTSEATQAEPNTHYKITLRRSAISLGDRIKNTLITLGIHRRNQTVYFPHSPIVAGKILKVKELVEVENVPESKVMTKEEQTLSRRPKRGYTVVSSRRSVI